MNLVTRICLRNTIFNVLNQLQQWFNDGRPELSCDFNGWGGQGAIQKFVDALGVAYHVC